MNAVKRSILVEKKENCCGCAACEAICPKCAVQMMLDEDGFYYPFVDLTQCVHCGKCMEVCPQRDQTL